MVYRNWPFLLSVSGRTEETVRDINAASNKMFSSLEEKRQHIIRRLSGKKVTIPVWTAAEVRELSGSLRTMRRIVVTSERQREELREYVKNLGLRPT